MAGATSTSSITSRIAVIAVTLHQPRNVLIAAEKAIASRLARAPRAVAHDPDHFQSPVAVRVDAGRRLLHFRLTARHQHAPAHRVVEHDRAHEAAAGDDQQQVQQQEDDDERAADEIELGGDDGDGEEEAAGDHRAQEARELGVERARRAAAVEAAEVEDQRPARAG